MQNRSPNFAVYQGTIDFFKKSKLEIFRGISLHIPRNLCIAMSNKYFFNLYILAGLNLGN